MSERKKQKVTQNQTFDGKGIGNTLYLSKFYIFMCIIIITANHYITNTLSRNGYFSDADVFFISFLLSCWFFPLSFHSWSFFLGNFLSRQFLSFFRSRVQSIRQKMINWLLPKSACTILLILRLSGFPIRSRFGTLESVNLRLWLMMRLFWT